MLDTLLAKVVGTQNERELKRLRPIVAAGQRARAGDSGAVRRRSCAARPPSSASGSPNGETLDDLLPEAFAVVREAGRRVLNMRHFDVQLIGGAVLHKGKIAEMKTGEGKTLVATLPAYLNALEGKGVHVVTVNDYLARRDSEWMGRIYRFLGMTVGVIQHDLNDAGAAGRLRRRHHLRHQQRVRLRLPARQHEVRARALRAARASLRDRRRGRQHPHRRSADAAHHLGPGRGVDRPVLRGRSHHPAAEDGRGGPGRHQGRGARGARSHRRLHRRREAQDGHADRERHGEGRGAARRRARAGRPLRSRRTCRSSTTSTRRCARTRSSSATSTTW